jgi:hypothetical protein
MNQWRPDTEGRETQIQRIRFRRNMFAADTHEPRFASIDITTKPGIDNSVARAFRPARKGGPEGRTTPRTTKL